jgi:hypothetical protein
MVEKRFVVLRATGCQAAGRAVENGLRGERIAGMYSGERFQTENNSYP